MLERTRASQSVRSCSGVKLRITLSRMPSFSLMRTTHLDIDDAPLLEVVPAVLFEQAVRVAADVDPLWLPRGLHPGCRVDRVSEQAITRHLDTHHARGALTAVDTCLNVFFFISKNLGISKTFI